MNQLPIDKTLNLLSKNNLPIAKCAAVKTIEAAAKEAGRIGYPVVLKGMSSEVIHKTDAGAIITGIKNELELAKAYSKIEKAVKKKSKKGIEFMLIQKEISGTEIIIGMKRDPQFGPVIMFGLGGVFVEVLKDVSFRIAPLEKDDCISMIKEIRGYAVLEGARGKKKANIEAIAKLLMSVSALAEKNKQIIEMDLNPIMVDEKSAIIADVRLMVE
jgi:acyl-CoA synthetase (NDP forming)